MLYIGRAMKLVIRKLKIVIQKVFLEKIVQKSNTILMMQTKF